MPEVVVRLATFSLLIIIVFALGLLLASACGGGLSAGNHILAGKFQHIVIIFQENRSPDNLFHDPALIAAGADIASSGINSKGQTIQLSPLPLATPFDLNHQHEAFVQMFDGGKMDGADKIEVMCTVTNCPPPNPQFSFVDPADVQPYFR